MSSSTRTRSRAIMKRRRSRGAALIEAAIVIPMLILFFGFFPKPMLQVIEPTSKATMSHIGMTDPAPVVKGAK